METLIEVNKKEYNDILIFNFTGELDETNADKTFQMLYKEIGDFSEKKIILHLGELKYLNSKSIGYIADMYSHVDEGNGQIFIANCDEWVKDVLELVGITTIIKTVDTLQEAVQELS